MLLRLWNNLRGYVMIEVSGFSVERFINLAVHRGIHIWNVSYTENGAQMCVSIPAFKLLKSCARKTGCRIVIREKEGVPFLLHRYRKRRILLFGILVFVGLLYFFSSFVWLIEITGNERLTTEELLVFSQQQGLQVGTPKHTLNEKTIENQFLNQFKDISWINVHVQGTKATLSLAETIPDPMIIDRSTPADVVAKKDGLITSIATSAGTPVVKQKDVVKKGDLLVSSELIVKNDETGIIKEYVHAQAVVWAKMYYDLVFTVPSEYSDKVYSGNSYKQYSVLVLDRYFSLPTPSNSYASYDKIVSRTQLKFGENYPLPVILFTEEIREFEPVTKKRSVEQMQELAERMVTSRIIREFDFEADIIDKQLAFEDVDGGLEVKARIITNERIDENAATSTDRNAE